MNFDKLIEDSYFLLHRENKELIKWERAKIELEEPSKIES